MLNATVFDSVSFYTIQKNIYLFVRWLCVVKMHKNYYVDTSGDSDVTTVDLN